MTDKRNRLWLVSVCLIGGCLAFGSASASAATTSNGAPIKTTVEAKVFDSSASAQDPPRFTYKAFVGTKGKPRIKKSWSKQRKRKARKNFRRRLKECKKGRVVVFFHDENGNDEFDRGEFKIGAAKTNEKGEATFVSGTKTEPGIIPPRGDRIGVWVKGGGGGCRGKQTSIPTL